MHNNVVTRFDYAANLDRAGDYGATISAFWPPAPAYEVFLVDLASDPSEFSAGFHENLAELAGLIESEWKDSKAGLPLPRTRLHRRGTIAGVLRQVATKMRGDDRRVLLARADCVEYGYDDERLATIAHANEKITVVAGQLSTWFGKEERGRPTAFACHRLDRVQWMLDACMKDRDALTAYFSLLHKGLVVGDVPAFVATELFFMAGEGNLHPKHIAYFLPEDEGVKRSPLKKTYYFANTHAAILQHISWPLFDEFVRALVGQAAPAPRPDVIPAAGVLAHEIGHFVQRASTSYESLNRTDRWISVVLQETAADVFGTLILTEVWGEALGVTAEQSISYYVAECLRYVSRGLGLFPDSDGMLLQLNYLAEFGALTASMDGECRLVLDTQAAIAGLRSLARVLADTLLDNRADRALALHRRYGPLASKALQPLLAQMRNLKPQSIEYVQNHIRGSVRPEC